MKYTVTENNIHLIDSYQVSKKKFDPELNKIQALHKDCKVFLRSRCSLKLEWASHNALFALGIAVSRTKDTDLNYPLKWYASIGYAVFGAICYPFIK